MKDSTTVEMPPSQDVPDMKVLRSLIPKHCFKSSFVRSMSYVIRDIILMSMLFYAGLKLTSLAPSISRAAMLTAYGFTQGLVFTGIWILAHDCGHDSFSPNKKANSVVGFVLHSILLVPFFSWKYSHARHHRYTNHMEKDTVFVPRRESDQRKSLLSRSLELLGYAEDAPVVNAGTLVIHQLFGWPAYILLNAGGGQRSLVTSDRSKSLRQSHLDPGADLFSTAEHPFVFLSNVGIAVVFVALWFAANAIGAYNVFLLYGIPYLWMNHWIVAITYLHHTHPEAPRYEQESWTFQKGVLATVDRDFGFIGRHLFHGIIEYHVIHHMFPRIPFYHAQEATEAISPYLGKAYIRQKSSFIGDLWTTYSTCTYVAEREKASGEVYWTSASLKAAAPIR
ncbi:oleate delta-12 desaturase [Pseudovirgaria hyperparasitica]|uniref:Oleate delta-12 desaturase n=1 Tax=Pseudovirgaria hyperparasitica TaxID=470096 RepID=A0A6A6WD58_9PEZI|nr:oleate delta-12 desaturase [Pseudovirgaria hyperparasitica]KAF2760505.1 oleate delta-12 desaturase [Pseudovirgaria hyperparasitica]